VLFLLGIWALKVEIRRPQTADESKTAELLGGDTIVAVKIGDALAGGGPGCKRFGVGGFGLSPCSPERALRSAARSSAFRARLRSRSARMSVS
jgi:hypothetical protein